MAALPFRYNAIAPGGSAASGAKLYVYAKDTTTPAVWYSDSGLTTPAANPLIADADGRWAAYSDSTVNYSIQGKTSDGATTILEADITAGVITVDYEISSLYHQDWTPMLTKATAFADLASATTTDIGAASSNNLRITGTTTITGLGTADAGVRRTLRFAAALTLTHNATSLILPGAANITTAANDTAEFVSLGSGNWICTSYIRAGSVPVLYGSGWPTVLELPAAGILDNLSGVRFVATYAALTALTTATGLSDGAVYCTRARTTADDGGIGLWRYDSASTSTANGGTTLAIDGGGAGRFFRIYDKGEVWAAWFGITTGSTSGSVPTNNVTAITAAMAQCSADGGGRVILNGNGSSYIAVDSSIDNIYNNVLVSGGTQFSTWSDAGTSPAYGVTILPTAAITVLKRRSPYNASNPRTIGGGFEGIRVIGNNTATRLLEVDSVIGAKLHLHLQDSVGSEAAKFISGVAGTNLADSCTIQLCDIKLIVRQDGQLSSGAGITSSRAADCVRWLGSSNANVSMNTGVMLDLVHYNGHGLVGDGDQNVFSFFRATRAGGTGLPIYGDGPTASIPVGFENNVFQHYSTNAAGYIEGTGDASVTAGVVNSIEFNDVGNASPRPTAGTASRWVIRDTSGRYTNLRAEGLAVGSATSEADSAGSGLTSSIAAYLYNGSNAHAYLATAGAVWRQYVDGSTGDLTFLQVTGTDDLLLPVRTKIAGEEINAWANWTPTISAGSGTLTTASGVAGSCRWSKVNNVVYFTVYIEVTTKGTGATSLRFTLPETAAITSVVYGYEGTGGALLVGLIASGSNVVNVYKTNGVDPLADATFYRVAGFYEAS